MDYANLRARAATGDLILLEARHLVGILVRVLTGQQISHVALLVWIDEGLWIAEMRNAGFSLAPASQRLPEMACEGPLYWGRAPAAVQMVTSAVARTILGFRGARYSWWSLVAVWVAQLLRRHMPSRLVCSTLVERAWASAGMTFRQTPDPGDFMRYCDSVSPLWIED